MNTFEGFPPGKINSIKIPETFFSEGLSIIQDKNELKLMLFFFWAFSQQEQSIKYLQEEELFESQPLKETLSSNQFKKTLKDTLKLAIQHNFVLTGKPKRNKKITLYFLNSARSRAALEALKNGTWEPEETDHLPFASDQQAPKKTIYQIYEENIGPLTPLIADDLKTAQEIYSAQWIQEAIHLAIQGNVRNWNYTEAILRSWKKEGKNANTRRDYQEDGRERGKSQFDDFIQH